MCLENSIYLLLLEYGDTSKGSHWAFWFYFKVDRKGAKFSPALSKGLVENSCYFATGTNTQRFVSSHECAEVSFPGLVSTSEVTVAISLAFVPKSPAWHRTSSLFSISLLFLEVSTKECQGHTTTFLFSFPNGNDNSDSYSNAFSESSPAQILRHSLYGLISLSHRYTRPLRLPCPSPALYPFLYSDIFLSSELPTGFQMHRADLSP